MSEPSAKTHLHLLVTVRISTQNSVYIKNNLAFLYKCVTLNRVFENINVGGGECAYQRLS